MVACALALLFGQPALQARADTQPVPGDPQTAAIDPLPTAQIDGVVWSQVIVGNKVFVGGQFTKARPAGVAPGGPGEVARTNLLAYDLTTGELDPMWAPVLNGQVMDLELSPDGSVLYAGGQFSTVDGLDRHRVAAFNTATGALLPFHPSINGTVNGLAATGDSLFVVGSFTSVGGQSRDGAARLSRTTGLATAFNPILVGGDPQAVVVSPDGSKVVLGGNFTETNGSNSPGYGLAMVTADEGASLPLAANTVVRNGNANASILSLEATSTGFYGTGYTYTRTDGNLEGVFKADWFGNLVWLEDCHGDSYGVYPAGDVVYQAGHSHYCGNIDGFPQPTTWNYFRGLAFSDDARGTVTREHLNYFNFEGQPRPDLLHFFPNFNVGTYTGQSQGPWDVTGNNSYVIYGGEFTTVNGVAQQGLVRFAKPGVITPKNKPAVDYGKYKPYLLPLDNGRLRVSWPAAYDRDNESLTYQLYRNSVKIYETQATSKPWWSPRLSFVDSGLAAGQSYTYSIRVNDPDRNVSWNAPTNYVYPGHAARSSYDQLVLQHNPQAYWGLDETMGASATDVAEADNAIIGTAVTKGVPGAIFGSSATAFQMNPTKSSTNTATITQAKRVAANTFSVEAWFKATGTKGGALINYGTSLTTNSGTVDRVVYLSDAGQVYFGVNPGQVRTVNSSRSYNDGNWHHVVATLDITGQRLYVDGERVGQRTDSTVGRNFDGVWRIGGDKLSGWTSNPSQGYFTGALDQVAVYPVALTPEQIRAHTSMGKTGLLPNQPPAPAFTETITHLQVGLDASASTDPDGSIASYEWDFGDGQHATGATAQHTYATAGSFTITLTVTDDRGGITTLTKQVTVASRVNQTPVASAVVGATDLALTVDGTASTDSDGTIASYQWDFGDGTSGTGATAQHTYAGPGTYTVKLTVTDNEGATSTPFSKEITVQAPNQLPTASFTADVANLKVSLDATTSSDPDGTVASYAWDFGDGETGTGATPDHTYAAGGTYTVRLVVRDDRDGASEPETRQVTVVAPNRAPEADFTTTVAELKVSLDASDSTDPDGSVVSYAWDFGDDETGSGKTATHTYADPGTYTIKLIVTDDEGAKSAAVTKQVTVSAHTNEKPVAAFTASPSSDLTASLDGTDSNDPDGSVASYEWDFGDGSTDTGAHVSHTYVGTGSYQVTLKVTDDAGATDTITKWVRVGTSGTVVRDDFERSSNRWGTADTGGTWTYPTGGSLFSTDGTNGVVKHNNPGSSATAALDGVSALNSTAFVTLQLDTNTTGGGEQVTLITRRVGTSDYRMTVQVHGDKTVRLNVTRRVNGVSTNLGDVKVAGLAYQTGDLLNIRFVVNGDGTTSLQGKVWKAGTPEPGTAQIRRTDSTAELQAPGAFSITCYASGSVTETPVTVKLDHLLVTQD